MTYTLDNYIFQRVYDLNEHYYKFLIFDSSYSLIGECVVEELPDESSDEYTWNHFKNILRLSI